jgi:hypothetical protein
MTVFACSKCGWVRRSTEPAVEASCPHCDRPASTLTPAGTLEPGRAALAAATARALHAPGVVPISARRGPPPPNAA